MPEINVIYQSRGGNTKRVADAIAEVCGVQALDVQEPHNVSSSDLLFIGMGIYGGKPDASILDYLDQLPVNTIRGAALFSTSATGKDCLQLAVNLLDHKGIQVYPKRLLVKGRFLFLNRGRPGTEELNQARAFAREVLDAFNG